MSVSLALNEPWGSGMVALVPEGWIFSPALQLESRLLAASGGAHPSYAAFPIPRAGSAWGGSVLARQCPQTGSSWCHHLE